jgi:hypothetical protein
MPLYIMEVLGTYEGIPGMLMASVFAAALRYFESSYL